MLSVLEINKRRQRRNSRRLTGIPDQHNNTASRRSHSTINHNNSSTVPILQHTSRASTGRDILLKTNDVRVTPVVSSRPRKLSSFNHMTSVIEVATRRALNHVPPPGFEIPPVLQNRNYNSSSNGVLSNNNLTIKGNNFNTCRTRNINSYNSYKSRDRLNFSANARLSNSWFATCCKTSSHTNLTGKKGKRTKLRNLKTEESQGPYFVDVQQYKDEIEGETIIVNTIQDVEDEQDDQVTVTKPYLYDIRLTPEHYECTFRYYERIAECRQQVLRAMYQAGDLLLHGILIGDKEDWLNFLYTTDDEIEEWREKCKKSNEYFAAHGKILGQDRWSLFKAFLSRYWVKLEDQVEEVEEDLEFMYAWLSLLARVILFYTRKLFRRFSLHARPLYVHIKELWDWFLSHARALLRDAKWYFNK